MPFTRIDTSLLWYCSTSLGSCTMTEHTHSTAEEATAEGVTANDVAAHTQPQEGVVQFAFGLSPEPGIEPSGELRAWREMLMRLGLIGQDPERYDGFAFGNLSERVRPTADTDKLVISASQTAHLHRDNPAAWVTVDDVSLERFWAEARGKHPPSSETMTHAMIYAAEPRASWVFHAHSPEIFRAADQLNLPATPADVPYGSPAMAQAVAHLLNNNMSRPLVFVTAGHEDGVFALGPTARDTGGLLVSYLARAIALGGD